MCPDWAKQTGDHCLEQGGGFFNFVLPQVQHNSSLIAGRLYFNGLYTLM
jgi:hypothetical protein